MKVNCFRLLGDAELNKLGIRQMPDYKDPYHQRPMTLGEIGCFLSHYNIWKQVVERGESTVLVLEDDVRFEPFFRRKFAALLDELEKLKLSWDLIYVGRKRLKEDEEWVNGSNYLVHVTYSYWTLGYLLSLEGAKKLLEAQPLDNLVPVDEYLPIMFDKHPRSNWMEHFPNRNLIAFSVAPLLVYPTHYVNDNGYISDTEDSVTIEPPPLGSVKEDL